jgi:hypothetical protein
MKGHVLVADAILYESAMRLLALDRGINHRTTSHLRAARDEGIKNLDLQLRKQIRVSH